MPTMDEYLAMMQPDPDANRKARIFQALGGLGAGLLSGGGWQRGLARGGLLAHDAMNDASNRASSDQMAQFKMRAAAQEMADKDSARESEAQFGKQLAAITSTAPRLNNMGTGGPTPANAAAVAPPDRVERLRQVAEFYAQNNKPDQAKKYFDAADAMEGTFSVDPKVGLGADGKPQFGQFSNKGGYRAAQGFAPPPDLQAVNLGDKTQFVDKLTTAPGTTFAAGMTPDAKASNALGWANNAVARQNAELQSKRLDQELRTSSRGLGLQEAAAVTALRKEYNDLPAVKSYQSALPIFESVQNSPDTKAGDLDLIYAVGKILDPGSVVREGEMILVTKSGSPAQRVTGYMNSLRGRGQLPPEQRKELREMLAGRMESMRGAAQSAASPYLKQAQSAGLPMDQVFSNGAPGTGAAQMSDEQLRKSLGL